MKEKLLREGIIDPVDDPDNPSSPGVLNHPAAYSMSSLPPSTLPPSAGNYSVNSGAGNYSVNSGAGNYSVNSGAGNYSVNSGTGNYPVSSTHNSSVRVAPIDQKYEVE
jgi:hypothetical protein